MSFTYNNAVPASGDNPSVDQPDMLTNAQAIASIIAVDHVGFNTAGGGKHLQVTFNSNNVPVPPVTPPVLFTNTVAGLAQLFFYSGDAAHSANQYTAAATGSTFLLGGIIMKWGVVLNPPSGNSTVTFSTAFPNNLYVAIPIGVRTNSSSVNSVYVNSGATFDRTTFGFTTTSSNFTKVMWVAIGN